MKLIYYSFKKPPERGWMVTDTKLKCTDVCGKSFLNAFRSYLWYLGVPAKKAFNFLRKNKVK